MWDVDQSEYEGADEWEAKDDQDYLNFLPIHLGAENFVFWFFKDDKVYLHFLSNHVWVEYLVFQGWSRNICTLFWFISGKRKENEKLETILWTPDDMDGEVASQSPQSQS